MKTGARSIVGSGLASFRGLDPPSLPQAVNGVLDMSGVRQNGADGVVVSVPVFTDYRSGDRLVLLFNGAPTPFLRRLPDPEGGVITLLVKPEWAPDGALAVSYAAVDAAGNGTLSSAVQVTVINGGIGLLPAPQFPEYPSGSATFRQVSTAGGAVIRASCQGLQVGDELALGVAGYTGSWALLPGTVRVLLTRLVTQNDILLGYIDAHASMSSVLAVGDGGRFMARCRVGRKNALGAMAPAAVSAAGVLLVNEGAAFVALGATSGVAPRSAQGSYLAPCNKVWVSSLPFRRIVLSVDAGVKFVGSDSSTLTVTTDSCGLASAEYYTNGTGVADVACTLGAYCASDNLWANAASTFLGSYRIGQNRLMSYCYRTAAVAGGGDPCLIYISAPYGAGYQIQVSVSGAALVSGYAAARSSFTHLDGSCTVSIIDDIAESVTVTLGSADQIYFATFDITFLASPFSG